MAEIKPAYRAAILIFLIITCLLIFFLPKERHTGKSIAENQRIEIGKPAPDFTYPDLSGNIVRLSDHRGKVVLVNIWATWCPPCIEEVPSMKSLYQKLKGEKFEILAVSIDQQGKTAVSLFMKKHKLNFTALLDPQGTIAAPYKATGVPESFIVDKNGILVQKIIGPINWESPEVIGFIRDLIQQPAS
jgi:peroxiredoxin